MNSTKYYQKKLYKIRLKKFKQENLLKKKVSYSPLKLCFDENNF